MTRRIASSATVARLPLAPASSEPLAGARRAPRAHVGAGHAAPAGRRDLEQRDTTPSPVPPRRTASPSTRRSRRPACERRRDLAAGVDCSRGATLSASPAEASWSPPASERRPGPAARARRRARRQSTTRSRGRELGRERAPCRRPAAAGATGPASSARRHSSTSSAAPSPASRAPSVPASSSGRIGSLARASTGRCRGPRPSASRVTPVTSSPARIACCTGRGAAPARQQREVQVHGAEPRRSSTSRGRSSP